MEWRKVARKGTAVFFLMFYSTGLSVNNTVAVFDAVFGRKNEFLRTLKFGIVNRSDEWKNKEYVFPFHEDYPFGIILCDLWIHGGFHFNIHRKFPVCSYDGNPNNRVHLCSLS